MPVHIELSNILHYDWCQTRLVTIVSNVGVWRGCGFWLVYCAGFFLFYYCPSWPCLHDKYSFHWRALFGVLTKWHVTVAKQQRAALIAKCNITWHELCKCHLYPSVCCVCVWQKPVKDLFYFSFSRAKTPLDELMMRLALPQLYSSPQWLNL